MNRRIQTNGITLNVQEHSKEGTPLIFLHYLGGAADIWNKIIPDFTDSHRVIAVDLRGHGLSDQPDSDYDIETVTHDVIGVLDTLHISKAHFIGSSYGCYVGTYLASRWPNRVLSLVNSEGALVNHSGPDGLYQESKEEHVAKIFSEPELEFESREAFMQYMKENWLPWNEAREQTMKDFEPRQLANGNYTFITKQKTIEQIVADLYEVRLQDWYETVECPVLFLPAEIEGNLKKKLALIREVEQRIPFCKTVIIPETEHAMMFDHYEQMNRAIKEFFYELEV